MSRIPDRPLGIALINAADYNGGAETVVRTLRDGLRMRGHEVVLWVGRRYAEDDPQGTRLIPASPQQREAAARYAAKGFFNLGIKASETFARSDVLSGFDLIHLHNAHGHYLSLNAIPTLAARRPLVWTFHDFFPITGGCAVPADCERWREACGACPQLGRFPLATAYDRTRRLLAVKRRLFRNLAVTVIVPSAHLKNAVTQSRMFPPHTALETIPPPLDTGVFRPGRERARGRLGITTDRPVVLFVAQSLEDTYKGVRAGVAALARVHIPRLLVLLVGKGSLEGIVPQGFPHEVRAGGYVRDRRALADWYAAADLLLFPSRAESFGCVVQEAMACGTPVLAYDIDGVAKTIEHGRTGFVCPQGDAAGMADRACSLLADRNALQRVGRAATSRAHADWSASRILERHENIYRCALDRADCAPSLSPAAPPAPAAP